VDQRDARVLGRELAVPSLRKRYEELQLPETATAAEKRRRGYALEELLAAALDEEGMNPRLRFRPSGEEIDGSFELDGRTYLLEAKWHTKPLPASSIYAFKAKADGKLIGTIGVFVSMSGYAEDAVDALTVGKVLNVVLFDKDDVEASIEHGFGRVIRAKLRAAAEEGVVFFPYTSTVADVKSDGKTEITDVPTDAEQPGAIRTEILIVCEGAADARVISILARRILEERSLAAAVRVVSAQGQRSISRLANSLYPLVAAKGPVIAVADGHGDPDAAIATVLDRAQVPLEVVVIDPELEAWFYPNADDPRAEARADALREQKRYEQYLEERAETANLDDLLESAPGFGQFYNTIISSAGVVADS
jgi:hypothetical protein